MYELINTEGLRAVVSGNRTIEFATATQEQLEYLFNRKSRYVRLVALEDTKLPSPPEPPADRQIKGSPSRKKTS